MKESYFIIYYIFLYRFIFGCSLFGRENWRFFGFIVFAFFIWFSPFFFLNFYPIFCWFVYLIFHIIFHSDQSTNSLVAQLVLKCPVPNALTKTNVCGGHAKMAVSARTCIHRGNMNVIVHSDIQEWIVNWNYWHLVCSHHPEISLLQLLFVLVHSYVSS